MSDQHIVETCRNVEDVEPSTLPMIPKGTYGICGADDGGDYPRSDFGPPWGIQEVSNADLLDAAAVLANAKHAIEDLHRPWRNVVRRALNTFAGSYMVLAVGEQGYHDRNGGFAVEAYLYAHGSKRRAIALLERSIALTGQRPDVVPRQTEAGTCISLTFRRMA